MSAKKMLYKVVESEELEDFYQGKLENQKEALNEKATAYVSPYMIPRSINMGYDAISGNIQITFNYINQETRIEKICWQNIEIDIGKLSKKILRITAKKSSWNIDTLIAFLENEDNIQVSKNNRRLILDLFREKISLSVIHS